MRKWLVMACALLLAGCTATSDTSDDEQTLRSEAPDGPREFEREDGDVAVALDPASGGFLATQTVRLANDVDALLSLLGYTVNGDVTVQTGSDDRYEVVVALRASGASEAEARRHLESMLVEHIDDYRDGLIDAGTNVIFTPYQAAPGPAGVSTTYTRSAALTITVPAQAGELRFHTVNGDIEVEGTHTQLLEADTTNGDVEADGFTARDVALDTTNGGVSASGSPDGSGSWTLDGTNGGISLQLDAEDSTALDLQADTTNGEVSIDAPGAQPVGEQEPTEQHVRTPGFDSSDVQVRVAAGTTNGDVDIQVR